MKTMNWQVGQRFTLISMNYAGTDLEFKIIGVLPDERWSQNFFFREDYFQEGTGDKDRFHMMWLRVRDPETGQRVAQQIEQMFEKSDTEVLVETESAGIARLTDRTKSIVAIVDVVWNGILESVKIAAMADAYEVNVAPHNFNGHLASLISSHFCAVVPNFRIMEIDIEDVPWKDELVTCPPVIETGELLIPTGPGWGAEINEDVVRAHPPLQRHGRT